MYLCNCIFCKCCIDLSIQTSTQVLKETCVEVVSMKNKVCVKYGNDGKINEKGNSVKRLQSSPEFPAKPTPLCKVNAHARSDLPADLSRSSYRWIAPCRWLALFQFKSSPTVHFASSNQCSITFRLSSNAAISISVYSSKEL